MQTTSRYRRTVVYRHLNYRWTLLGLGAGEWLVVLAPSAVYLAAVQLSLPWAGAVPWPSYVGVLIFACAAGSLWAAAQGLRRQGAWVALGGTVAGWTLLGWLTISAAGLPIWPAFSIAAGLSTYAVGLQFHRPPGALRRLAANLLLPRRLLAGRVRRGLRQASPIPGATP